MSSNFALDGFSDEVREFVVEKFLKGVSNKRISELLKEEKDITISSVAVWRWWQANKENYTVNSVSIDEELDAEKTIDELLAKLDKSKLKDKEIDQRLLAQDLLRELMLFYTVDIHRQTKLKQQNVISHYPLELIKALKIISDLYLSLKDKNRNLRHGDDMDDKGIFT